MSRQSGFDRSFSRILSVPLAFYIVIIVGLLLGVFSSMTLEAIQTAFGDKDLRYAIKLSIITSILSTLFSMLIAIPGGYVLSRKKFPGDQLLDTILDMPIVLPPLVMGLAVLIFFNTGVGRLIDRGPWGEGAWNEGIFIYQPAGIVLVQFIIGAAIAIRVVKAGFDSFDERLEQMAYTLGANQWQALFRVVLPNVVPSLVAAMVICWARIFGLFGPVLLVAGTMRGRTEIMPTTIFLETSIGRIEVALVIGALMILISMATLSIFKKLGGKGYLW